MHTDTAFVKILRLYSLFILENPQVEFLVNPEKTKEMFSNKSIKHGQLQVMFDNWLARSVQDNV